MEGPQAGMEGQSKEGSQTVTSSLLVSSQTPPAGAWDPLNAPDWDSQKLSSHCLQRIQRDLTSLFKEPPPGIFVIPDEDNLTTLHALVVGPYDSPYEGGFFYFRLRCPPDYPIRPPRIRLMTTGNDSVRFNPNLYKNGKVCLSILGTWSGPSWTPSQSLSSILISIQSLMNENPYHNEPGFEKEHAVGDSERYNQIIAHETLRVAVCGMLDDSFTASQQCPQPLKQMIQALFHSSWDHYMDTCKGLEEAGLQGTQMLDPFGEKRGKFDPVGLRTRLEGLKGSVPEGESETGGAE